MVRTLPFILAASLLSASTTLADSGISPDGPPQHADVAYDRAVPPSGRDRPYHIVNVPKPPGYRSPPITKFAVRAEADENDDTIERREALESLLNELAQREEGTHASDMDGYHAYTTHERRQAIGMALRPIARIFGESIRKGLGLQRRAELEEDEHDLQARGAIGMALRPLAKIFGESIRKGMGVKRRGQLEEEDIHELEARGAIGMALRPIAQIFGESIRKSMGIKRRADLDEGDVHELEARQAIGMALRPLAKAFGESIRNALEHQKREEDWDSDFGEEL
ncbi:hypothetical protein HGRIS_003098 [Hohenbuehelia grisea]|uniref:Uncharacterized protein n=1 Tax=Hohenbuehelia grisea TaxID=104357 RepID=A0ABR3JNQ0_9AGAR